RPAQVVPWAEDQVTTSLLPYDYQLLDSRSGYPAGIRDPGWREQVLHAGGDAARVDEALTVAVVAICRELRRTGHVASASDVEELLRALKLPLPGSMPPARDRPPPLRLDPFRSELDLARLVAVHRLGVLGVSYAKRVDQDALVPARGGVAALTTAWVFEWGP